jgi:hypothetical protein
VKVIYSLSDKMGSSHKCYLCYLQQHVCLSLEGGVLSFGSSYQEHSKFENFFVYPYEIYSIHGMVHLALSPSFYPLHHTMES